MVHHESQIPAGFSDCRARGILYDYLVQLSTHIHTVTPASCPQLKMLHLFLKCVQFLFTQFQQFRLHYSFMYCIAKIIMLGTTALVFSQGSFVVPLGIIALLSDRQESHGTAATASSWRCGQATKASHPLLFAEIH